MSGNEKIKAVEQVAIRFSGDSGDGMQLVGGILSTLSAVTGYEISTFPDYPAEMRAPQGSLGGVSGYQLCIGKQSRTPGDRPDVLVAMNPAALKVNAKLLREGAVVIIDEDCFTEGDFKKAKFETNNPFEELHLGRVQVVPVRISTMVKDSLKDSGLDLKAQLRCKNMFALGLSCWLFNLPIVEAIPMLQKKFSKKPLIEQAVIKVLGDGFNYGENIHASVSTYKVETSGKKKAGTYTDINGNSAIAYGLIAGAEKAGLQLFLGSYPITPATEILHELAARKDVGVKVMQCEDEIASICSAIGASFAGCLACTSTSGPGLALKSEALGLAVMAELPIVLIDVQRGGPSTGLPTKPEQGDLLQAVYGRNGECPVVVLAPKSPTDCFDMACKAAKIAVENMTPVIVLIDAFVAHGSSAWRIPEMNELEDIHPPFVNEEVKEGWKPYLRQLNSCVRYWAKPGEEGFTHRLGSLEKHGKTSAISTEPTNHQNMVKIRAKKVQDIADTIPEVEVLGDRDADTLVVGWGSTYGHLLSAVEQLNRSGKQIAYAHFNYIRPLPKNTEALLKKYKRVVVFELNNGQFVTYLRSQIEGIHLEQYNKIQGIPFTIQEIIDYFA
ncbi:MAG TPA: 2-oxoacid:acceptor oxidoreductase subunit alpha [Porphyromonadaceae bacterium]|nr:2-oxoacid:acceptor oxidoreductase subunit alpha [Porphyromonadaceae bacterium]